MNLLMEHFPRAVARIIHLEAMYREKSETKTAFLANNARVNDLWTKRLQLLMEYDSRRISLYLSSRGRG